jgi:uncharacterized cupin superfamily protein
MPASIRIDPAACPAPEGVSSSSKAYADPTGALIAGVWRSKPNRLEVTYKRDEFCLLLEGEVHLTDSEGRTEIYRAGDAFMVPAGFVGVWDMPVAVAKYYVLHTPKA